MTDGVRSTVYLNDGAGNRGRKIGGAPRIWAARAWVVGRGRTYPILMTEAMLHEAAGIAARNPEDCGVHAPDRFRSTDGRSPSGLVFGLTIVISMLSGVALGSLM